MVSPDQQEEVENVHESPGRAEVAPDTAASAEPEDSPLGLSRRGMLVGGGLLGLLGLGMGSAGADASGQVGTTNDPLTNLHTEKLNGISLDLNNADDGQILKYSGSTTLTHSDLEVSQLVTDMSAFEVGIGATGGGASRNQPSNIRGGHEANNTDNNSFGASILGGGDPNEPNEITRADRSVIIGGQNNIIDGTPDNADYAVILGGLNNTADAPHSLASGKDADTGGKQGSFVWGDSTDTTVTASAENEVRFQAGGGFVVEGTITATGTVTENSSARYKSNIRPLNRGRSSVLDLEPKKYEFNKTGNTNIGLIAEEVEEILPELVKYNENDEPDAVNYSRVGMLLAPEVSENRDRLETIEAAREEFEETIEKLEVELDAKDARLADQADRIEHLESTVENKSILLEGVQSVVDEKEARIDELEAENTKLETRLSAVEIELGFGGVTADASVADD